MTKYDIFISYRREGGYDTAKHLYDLLSRDGYSVSFDIDTLRNGDFDITLLHRIDECRDFILIIDAHAFDRTLNPNFNPNNDWLRQELAYALKLRKNIIPVFLSGTKGFPDSLPNDIINVTKKNGPEYNRYYFNDFYNRIKHDFLESRPRKRLWTSFIAGTAIIALITVALLWMLTDKGHPASQTSNSNEVSALVDEFRLQVTEHNNAWWTLFSNNPYLSPISTERENTPANDEFYHRYYDRMTYKGKLQLSGKALSISSTGHPETVTIQLYGPNAGVHLFKITCESALNGEINPEDIANELGFTDIIYEKHYFSGDRIIYQKDNIYFCLTNSYGSGGNFITMYFSIDQEDFYEQTSADTDVCMSCNGSGWISNPSDGTYHVCDACGGTGEIAQSPSLIP